MENTNSKKNLIATIGKGIAMAMGVAVIVMGILGTLLPATANALLAIGLVALALALFQQK